MGNHREHGPHGASDFPRPRSWRTDALDWSRPRRPFEFLTKLRELFGAHAADAHELRSCSDQSSPSHPCMVSTLALCSAFAPCTTIRLMTWSLRRYTIAAIVHRGDGNDRPRRYGTEFETRAFVPVQLFGSLARAPRRSVQFYPRLRMSADGLGKKISTYHEANPGDLPVSSETSE